MSGTKPHELGTLLFALWVCVMSVWVSPVRADEVLGSVASPGHVLGVSVTVDADGKLAYQVERNGKPVIAPSRLGFILTNAPKLDRGFTLDAAANTTHDDTWEQPWGERQYVRNHYNELRLTVVQKAREGRKLIVVFRVYDDGLGFRYEFPDQPLLKTVKIADELTEFAVVEPATAWWNVAGEWNREEYLIQKTPLNEVSESQTPMTIKTQSGLHIAFHEAALVDYAAIWMRRVDGQRLKTRLAPSAFGPSVVREAPFVTPWRTMQIADTAGGLYMSDLILNLNEPNKLGDVSWVKPYKYVGIWWEMHLGLKSWGSGPNHGATTANVKKYIDFAAQNGFRGVLIEGWNKGWDGEWFGNGSDYSFTEAYPDFDLKGVTDYARSNGVRIVGHNETGGNAAVYEAQMKDAFAFYEKLGIDSVKTGYVADAGGAQVLGPDGQKHYTFNDSQEMVRHFQNVVDAAAKNHIAIDTHEPIKDTGLRRTYPNWVSREGQRGQEYNAWGKPPNPPEHEANLVFTRMLSGPMDFTPGILSLQGNNQPINATQAKELAQYIVLYSPIHMAADLPENYAKYPKAFKFIKDVPTDWADTKVLNGEIGDYATIARKDRHSDNWYIGAVTDENARALEIDLSFLDPKRTYVAEIYRDGPTADFTGPGRFDLVIEQKTVKSADKLSLWLAKGGGFAIRLVAK